MDGMMCRLHRTRKNDDRTESQEEEKEEKKWTQRRSHKAHGQKKGKEEFREKVHISKEK